MGLNISDGKIDWNRFTLPNRNEKFRFSTTAIRFSYVHHCAARWRDGSNSAKAISSSVAMRAGRSWLQCTGPAASGPESRTLGVDCGGGSESDSEYDRARCPSGFSGGGALRPLIHLRQRIAVQ